MIGGGDNGMMFLFSCFGNLFECVQEEHVKEGV